MGRDIVNVCRLVAVTLWFDRNACGFPFGVVMAATNFAIAMNYFLAIQRHDLTVNIICLIGVALSILSLISSLMFVGCQKSAETKLPDQFETRRSLKQPFKFFFDNRVEYRFWVI